MVSEQDWLDSLMGGPSEMENYESRRIDYAHNMFDKLPQRDLVLWNTIVAAYSRDELCDEALRLFYQMQQTRVQPNQFTFASILPACASLERARDVFEAMNPQMWQHREGMHHI
jgi:pentatricopeptide repeat protein